MQVHGLEGGEDDAKSTSKTSGLLVGGFSCKAKYLAGLVKVPYIIALLHLSGKWLQVRQGLETQVSFNTSQGISTTHAKNCGPLTSHAARLILSGLGDAKPLRKWKK